MKHPYLIGEPAPIDSLCLPKAATIKAIDNELLLNDDSLEDFSSLDFEDELFFDYYQEVKGAQVVDDQHFESEI